MLPALHPTLALQPLDLTAIDQPLPTPLPGLVAGYISKISLLSALNPELGTKCISSKGKDKRVMDVPPQMVAEQKTEPSKLSKK